jgi:hypothetical protein
MSVVRVFVHPREPPERTRTCMTQLLPYLTRRTAHMFVHLQTAPHQILHEPENPRQDLPLSHTETFDKALDLEKALFRSDHPRKSYHSHSGTARTPMYFRPILKPLFLWSCRMTCFPPRAALACVQMLCDLVIGRIERGEARGYRVLACMYKRRSGGWVLRFRERSRVSCDFVYYSFERLTKRNEQSNHLLSTIPESTFVLAIARDQHTHLQRCCP